MSYGPHHLMQYTRSAWIQHADTTSELQLFLRPDCERKSFAAFPKSRAANPSPGEMSRSYLRLLAERRLATRFRMSSVVVNNVHLHRIAGEVEVHYALP